MKKQFLQSSARWRSAIWGVVLGCVASGDLYGETVGEHFRRVMAEKESFCKAHPPAPGDTQCDRLKLKPRDWSETTFVKVEGQPEPVPEEWVATAEGKFAHSIKLPDPLPKDSGYRPGMTSEEYFNHLCQTEAGEFIYKTVENVEGIFQIRRRMYASDYMLEHLYAMEDPNGYRQWETRSIEDYLVQPPLGKYQYLEVTELDSERQNDNYSYKMYFRNISSNLNKKVINVIINGRSVVVPYIVSEKPVVERASRFGYVWRGIVRKGDRELGIAGGELIVVDTASSTVLAVKRGFIKSGNDRARSSGIWWLSGENCPQNSNSETSLSEFIYKILKPLAKD